MWLAEKMENPAGTKLKVSTAMLERSRLEKLDWEDVEWWVYQGAIPPEAIGFPTPRLVE